MKKILLPCLFLAAFNLHAQTEDCGNGIDDDGDGLIDCADPDCSSASVPTGALFNTATNGVGGTLAGGSFDLHWDISVGSYSGPYTDAIVMSSIPGSYYASPWPDCDWISHNALGTHSVDMDFYYRIQFYLPCTTPCGTPYSDSAVFCLNMDFYADNSVDEVYVNGVPQSPWIPGVPDIDPYYHVGFSAGAGISLQLCSGWVPGLNELIIKVSSGPGYEGFLAQNSTTTPPTITDASISGPADNTNACLSGGTVTCTSVTPGGTWSATCGTCIDAATGVFDPTIAGVGSYTVTYTVTSPCVASDSITLNVIDDLDPTITAVAAVCANAAPFAFTAADAGGTWSATCGACINSVTGVFDPSAAGAGTYTITHSFGAPCAASDNESITVLAVPNATINPIPVFCPTMAPYILTAATSGGTWSATCGSCINASTGEFDPSMAGAGTFTITYTIGGTCPANNSITATVTPIPDPTINPPGLICAGDPAFNFTAASTGGTWSASCGGCINSVTGLFNPTYGMVGNYFIFYTSAGACGYTDTLAFTVDGAFFVSVDPTDATCYGYNDGQVYISASGMGVTTIVSVSGPPHASNFVDLVAGTYVIAVTSPGGCTDTATFVINSPSPVVASFNADQTSGLVPLNVNFTNTSVGATGYTWDFGNGTGATTVNGSAIYTNQNNYIVTLVAVNGPCSDTATMFIDAILPSELVVYNVFTPNGDGMNDTFITTNINLKDFSVKIFDRWGLLMFESTDQTKGWDGKDMNGKIASDGTYYYIVKATGLDDKMYDQHGAVTVFRKK